MSSIFVKKSQKMVKICKNPFKRTKNKCVKKYAIMSEKSPAGLDRTDIFII